MLTLLAVSRQASLRPIKRKPQSPRRATRLRCTFSLLLFSESRGCYEAVVFVQINEMILTFFVGKFEDINYTNHFFVLNLTGLPKYRPRRRR